MKKIYVNPSIKKIQLIDTPILAGSMPIYEETREPGSTEEATEVETLGKKYNSNFWSE